MSVNFRTSFFKYVHHLLHYIYTGKNRVFVGVQLNQRIIYSPLRRCSNPTIVYDQSDAVNCLPFNRSIKYIQEENQRLLQIQFLEIAASLCLFGKETSNLMRIKNIYNNFLFLSITISTISYYYSQRHVEILMSFFHFYTS